ncbi:RNA polymerase subunit sigma-24 [Pseudofrankia asymbiotica]|uniref:RNA polymerase subunit sigma-24 n=1 Tax=Pseudofrankia asymbiotica TaxID=1834516 RepID=A0A1V2HZL0_9ACTN|nr:RNA polymerase subunit sigma-24 [Pseudofrankia asymbiotica]
MRELRAGDERVFAELVDRMTPAMLAIAAGYVPGRSVAEEVVQEAWLAVLTGLDRFEGRSSLRTWVFGIVVNVARRRGARERRSVPFSDAFAFAGEAGDEVGPTVDPGRFRGRDDEWPGHWASPPRPWDLPESALLAGEVRDRLRAALDVLPPRQRMVVHLRDVQGLAADEVCAVLGIEPGNQRVLLHRGRARLRQALEDYLNGDRA